MQSRLGPTTALASSAAAGGPDQPLDLSGIRTRRLSERLIHGVLFLCGAVSILTTVGIVVILLTEAITFFTRIPISEFLFGTRWTPAVSRTPVYGVLGLVGGTLIIAGIAMAVAIPLGLASAIYLSEYAPSRVRSFLKPAIEFLAGIPTIVYGYFALTFITPELTRRLFPEVAPQNGLTAGFAVGILIIPLVASLSEDAMRAVPRALREGGYALGATKLEVALKVVFPAAFSGIVAASILAISVAIGETMIVTLAAGSKATSTANPLDQMQTMTGAIVGIFAGDEPRGTTTYYSLFAIGLLLFVLTLVLNVISQLIAARFREAYE